MKKKEINKEELNKSLIIIAKLFINVMLDIAMIFVSVFLLFKAIGEQDYILGAIAMLLSHISFNFSFNFKKDKHEKGEQEDDIRQ